MDNIYVVRGSEQAGPFTEADIRAQLASGALTGDSLVWWEGLAEWTPISKTPLGSPAATKLAPAPAAIPTPMAPVAAAATPADAVAPVAGGSHTSVLAIVSLVLGILGLPLIICSIFGMPVQLAAIVTGHIARVQIAKDPTQSGAGLALGGLICGYLGAVVVLGIFIFALAFGSHLQAIVSQMQSQLNSAQMMTNSAPANP
jgi:hypothetical protein